MIYRLDREYLRDIEIAMKDTYDNSNNMILDRAEAIKSLSETHIYNLDKLEKFYDYISP